MKKILFSFILGVITLSTQAQSYDQEVDFGIRLKYGYTIYSNYKPGNLPAGYDISNNGYGGGIFMQFRVNHFYFQPELNLGFASSSITAPSDDPNIDSQKLDLDFTSVAVPLLIGYRPSFGETSLRFGAGVIFNFLLNTNGELINNPGGSSPVPEDNLKAFNSITLGARFNIGVDIGPILIDVAYQSSFTRLGETFAILGGPDLGKENTWIFGVGYKLFRNRL